MRTDKQIAASRANGSLSKGPSTPAGKRNSRLNSLQHGNFAKTILLPGESDDAFYELLDTLHIQFHPMTPLESIVVQKMGAAIWRQIRLWSFDQVHLARECAKIRQASPETDLNPLTIGALAFHSILQATGSENSFQMHEMRYDRQFSIALNQLNHLRKMRNAPPSSAPLRDPESSGTNPTSA